MADSSTFLDLFPEFTSAMTVPGGPAMVNAAIAAGVASCGLEFWGANLDLAIYLTAADHLALSPYGENLRLKDTQETIYRLRLRQMMKLSHVHVAVGGGFLGGF